MGNSLILLITCLYIIQHQRYIDLHFTISLALHIEFMISPIILDIIILLLITLIVTIINCTTLHITTDIIPETFVG